MSEVQQQDTELVTGTITEIKQRAVDKWQVAVTPAGSKYAKNLWTKDAALVTELTQKIGQDASFLCNASHWTNNEGKNVRSLWISIPALVPADGGEVAAPAVATASPAQQSKPQDYQRDYSPETQARVDEAQRRQHRADAWKVAGLLVGPQQGETMPQIVSSVKLMVELIYVDICRSHDFAHPNLGADVEFGEPADVPFD